MSAFRKVGFVLWATIVAYAIALLLQGVWTVLMVQNLRFHSEVPWSVVPMLVVLWLAWLWLSGRVWPRITAQSRRDLLRARQVKGIKFLLAFIAGALGVIVRSLVAHSREASIVIERCQHGSFAEKLWATRFGLVEIQPGDESSAASWFFEQSEGADIFHIYPQDATRQQLLEIRDRRWSLNFVGTSVVFQGEL